MSLQGIQESPYQFNAPTDMETARFVVLTDATQTVAYATDVVISGVTVGNEDDGVISVVPLNDPRQIWIVLGGTVTVGMDLIADATGKAIDGSATGSYFAKSEGIAGDTIGIYPKLS